MSGRLIIGLILLFPILGKSQSAYLQQILSVRDSIKYIDLHAFKYNRPFPYSRNPQKALAKVLPKLKLLPNEDIQTLLTNENPRNRALGILALYQSDNQNSILQLLQYLSDSSECYKQTPYNRFSSDVSSSIQRPSIDSLLTKARTLTVGEIAKTLFGHYLLQLGYSYFDDGFKIFIQKSKEITYSAGFLKWLKLKATGGIEPFQEDRRELFEQLKFRISKISSQTDQAIYKIYLSVDEHELYDQADRLTSLRFLGKRHVKSILSRFPLTKDPCLVSINDSTHSDFDYGMMCKWILKNAHYLFKKEDIPFLLARAEYEDKKTRYWNTRFFSPYWFIACANIDPMNSPMYIGFGLSRHKGEYQEFERAELYASLWHASGERELNFILDWFFNSYKKNARSQERLDHFIHQLTSTSDLKLIKHIIADDRFYNYIKVSDVKHIAWQVNHILKEEFISHQSISMVDNPYPGWVEQFEASYDTALENYPMEVKEMLERTEQLKNKLRNLN